MSLPSFGLFKFAAKFAVFIVLVLSFGRLCEASQDAKTSADCRLGFLSCGFLPKRKVLYLRSFSRVTTRWLVN